MVRRPGNRDMQKGMVHWSGNRDMHKGMVNWSGNRDMLDQGWFIGLVTEICKARDRTGSGSLIKEICRKGWYSGLVTEICRKGWYTGLVTEICWTRDGSLVW